MSDLRKLLGSMQETGRFAKEVPFERILKTRSMNPHPEGWPHYHNKLTVPPADPLGNLWQRRQGLGVYIHPRYYDPVLRDHCRIPEDWK